MEIWKPVVGYEAEYEVSNIGRVRRIKTGRVLKPRITPHGYNRVVLSKGEAKHALVHRLVLAAFCGPRPDGMESCHGNGDRADNRIENLRWDTRANNHADKKLHGTLARGERCGKSKLTEADVRFARAMKGVISTSEIARRLGVVRRTVAHIFNGDTWSHVK